MKRSSRTTYLTGVSEHKNHLQNIKATITQAPTMADLEAYIPEFVSLTWLTDIEDIEMFLDHRGLTREDVVNEMFEGRTLPTALETVRITMLLEGLDMTNVTHIIRHRMFGFSAQSSGWGSMEGHDFLHNDAYEEHDDLLERAMDLCEKSMELYADALDRGMTFYDARQYLVHAIENKYFMTGCLKDWMAFINQRLDRTNQPTSDNILALRCRQQLLKLYPQLAPKMPPKGITEIYMRGIDKKFNVNTYPPDAEHRLECERRGIDWESVQYDNPKPRDEYSCNDKFEQLFEAIVNNEL